MKKKQSSRILLNDETAAFLVAKDLNVEIDDANVSLVPLNILDETHKNVNILVTIKRIFPKKEYKNGDKEGFYTNAIVYDNSKEMSITFWNKDFELSSGDIVLIKNVYVTKFKDGLKLNTSKLSEIKKKGKKEITLEEVSLNDLKENDSGKIVTGVLIRKRELRYFEKEGVKKAVFRFTLANESIKISVVVWGNLAEDIEKINENTKIKIKNVYVKLNNNWKEIHMTDNSSYEILEENVILDTEPILKDFRIIL
jgi:ssDNA-binding replication factor A large subunit